LFAVFRYDAFFSVWYWALTVVVWTLVCQRTLGVPHDMVVRAARAPLVAARVDALARIGAERLAGLGDALGAPAAAAAGFGLATLLVLGYGQGHEAARAALLLLGPLCVVGVGAVRLARHVRATGLAGEALRRRLARRRAVNQAIAAAAMLTAAVTALAHPPPGLRF
jgi:hypothetical protein